MGKHLLCKEKLKVRSLHGPQFENIYGSMAKLAVRVSLRNQWEKFRVGSNPTRSTYCGIV